MTGMNLGVLIDLIMSSFLNGYGPVVGIVIPEEPGS